MILPWVVVRETSSGERATTVEFCYEALSHSKSYQRLWALYDAWHSGSPSTLSQAEPLEEAFLRGTLALLFSVPVSGNDSGTSPATGGVLDWQCEDRIYTRNVPALRRWLLTLGLVELAQRVAYDRQAPNALARLAQCLYRVRRPATTNRHLAEQRELLCRLVPEYFTRWVSRLQVPLRFFWLEDDPAVPTALFPNAQQRQDQSDQTPSPSAPTAPAQESNCSVELFGYAYDSTTKDWLRSKHTVPLTSMQQAVARELASRHTGIDVWILDLLFEDTDVPTLGGPDVVRTLRQTYLAHHHGSPTTLLGPLIIAYSGFSSPFVAGLASSMGVDLVVPKGTPVGTHESATGRLGLLDLAFSIHLAVHAVHRTYLHLADSTWFQQDPVGWTRRLFTLRSRLFRKPVLPFCASWEHELERFVLDCELWCSMRSSDSAQLKVWLDDLDRRRQTLVGGVSVKACHNVSPPGKGAS